MHRTIVLLALITACASGKRATRECAPLPTDYQTFGELYQECSVEQKARVVTTPRPDFSRLEPLVTTTAGCYQAVFTLIVDAKGLVVPRSVRLVRSNSQSYAAAISDQFGAMRFEPAKRGGLPVAQLFEYESKLQYRLMSGTGSRRPPPC